MRSREETRHLETALKGDRRLRPEDGSVCVRVKWKVRGERDIVEENGLPVARDSATGNPLVTWVHAYQVS